MATQSRLIAVSDRVYRAIEERAKAANRTIEQELAGHYAVPAPRDEAAFRKRFDAMDSLADEALVRAAKTRLTIVEGKQIERLHLKRNERGLSAVERERLARLMKKYERANLVKAKALALLRERGHDISEFLKNAS